MSTDPKITITKNGPYVVSGKVPLTEDALAKNAEGVQDFFSVRTYTPEEEPYALCRCGNSKHKPFCDGSHVTSGFVGTETAGHSDYLDRAEIYEGEDIDLYDDNRCAYARLCHQKGGDVWTLTETEEGGEREVNAVRGSWHCPTGRLEHHDNETGEVYEQKYDPSIVILEDTEEGVSGPLFVRGGIPLYGEDGEEYQVRNRYALCRCGASGIKPFCEAEHVNVQFNDGSPALEGQFGAHDDSFSSTPDIE